MAKINDFDRDDSFDDVEDLLGMIMPGDKGRPIETFIGFLDARLANQNWTTGDLARRIDQTTGWVIRLLDGQIPAEQLTDEQVVRIANAIEYEPNVLRIMLHRDIVPTVPPNRSDEPEASTPVDEALEDFHIEIDRLIEAIKGHLQARVDERYDDFIRNDGHISQQNDIAIKRVEIFIAKHRKDIHIIELLVDELKATLVEDDSRYAVHHRDIRRIIHTIQSR